VLDVKARFQVLSQREMGYALPYLVPAESRPLYAWAKRSFDVFLSAVLLLLLSPLMAIIAVIIRLDSPGAAIFKQRRVGKGGKDFTLYKFRSMYHSADESVHRAFAQQYIRGECAINEQGCYKPREDSRVTRVGHFLRLTSLDELPQLWNVLTGDMSLVGPRPAMRYEVDEYKRWQLQRLFVPPGLTGLAQISGRSGLTFDKIIRLDLQYVEKRDFWLDFKIVLKTIPMVLLARCAA